VGMTQGTMAIEILNLEEGEKIKKYIESDTFKNILNACSWSNFRIDWMLFTYFKKLFYMEINNKVVVINVNKPEIIKNGRSNYYLIENKLNKIKKDKTQGEYHSDYIDEKIIEIINNEKPKKLITPFYISNADFYIVLNHIKIIYNSFLFFVFYFLEHISLVFHKHP
jgi:hypothetical protein